MEGEIRLEGINILALEIIMKAAPWTTYFGYGCVVLLIIGVIALGIGIASDIESVGLTGLLLIPLSFVLSIIAATCSSTYQVPDYTQYEVIINDSVSMNEFTSKYEILEQRGQIYVVKEIEE